MPDLDASAPQAVRISTSRAVLNAADNRCEPGIAAAPNCSTSPNNIIAPTAPFVKDEKIEAFDASTEELLSAIASMGQEGAAAKAPDCAVLLELRARMKVLVDTQTARWTYVFEKIETELWK